MCVNSFVQISGLDGALCDYLFAKFVIFCVFASLALLYRFTTAFCRCEFHLDNFALLCLTAILFEFWPVAIVFITIATAVYACIEFVSMALLCGLGCVTLPILVRAEARHAFVWDCEDWIATRALFAFVCELVHIARSCIPNRVAPVPFIAPQPTPPAFITQGDAELRAQMTEVVRFAMRMV